MRGRGIPWRNVAVNGYGYGFLNADKATRLHPQLTISPKNVLLLQGGQGDVAGADTAAVAFGRVTAYADSARAAAVAAGNQIYIIEQTMPPSTFLFPTEGALETKRLAYNALIRLDGGAHFDAVDDLVADPLFADSTSIYFSDTLHLSPEGAQGNADRLAGPLATAWTALG